MSIPNIKILLNTVNAAIAEGQNTAYCILVQFILQLMTAVRALMAQIETDSSNSSTPPSKDRNRGKRTEKEGKKGKNGKSGKSTGGQPGQKGHALHKVDNPDEIVYLKLDRSLYPSDFTVIGFENRQVVQIITSRHVIEYRAEVMIDSTGQKKTAEFPPGVSRPVQYGSEVKRCICLLISLFPMSG